MDLATAVTIFLQQSLCAQGLPFTVTRDIPNAETVAAMCEYEQMKEHPGPASRRGYNLDLFDAVVTKLAGEKFCRRKKMFMN